MRCSVRLSVTSQQISQVSASLKNLKMNPNILRVLNSSFIQIVNLREFHQHCLKKVLKNNQFYERGQQEISKLLTKSS